MITIPTEDQVEARLEVLPENLSDALFSIEVTNLGEEIGLSKGLKDGDIPLLAEVIAWVLMGFTHSSAAEQAIQEYVGAAPETAKAIAQELDQKIFGKYRVDLEKIYAPMKIRPAGMMDVSPSTTPAKAPAAPMPIAPMPMAPKMPMPTAATLPKTPLPAGVAKEEPKGWQPTKLPVAGAAPISTATPAPFMMHQESSASPLVTSSDFKLNISKDMFKSGPAKQMDIPRPPKAAELEIGKAPLPPKPAGSASFSTSPISQSRVVHYTDLKTSMPTGFPAAQPMPMPKAAPTSAAPAISIVKPATAPVMKAVSAPLPPAPISQTASPAMPAMPTIPTQTKPPKVVNFGPEEVK